MGIGSDIYTTGMRPKPRHSHPYRDFSSKHPYRDFGHGTHGMGATTDIAENAKNQLSKIFAAIRAVGFPPNVEQWLLVQAYGESGGFTNRAYNLDNNPSGIKWLNKPYQTATKGIHSSENNYYAHYANLVDWAKDMKRILSFGAKPYNAANLTDYVHRLKQNRYFQSDENAYLKLLQGIAQRMRIIAMLNNDAAQEIVIPPNTYGKDEKIFDDKNKGMFPKFEIPKWVKPVAIVGLVIAGLSMLKRS